MKKGKEEVNSLTAEPTKKEEMTSLNKNKKDIKDLIAPHLQYLHFQECVPSQNY